MPGGRQELVSIEEFSGKVRAAADARQGSDLVIIARTEALIAGWGVEEALSRAHHYAEAGAGLHPSALQVEDAGRGGRVHQTLGRRGAARHRPDQLPSLTEEQVRRLGKIQLMIYANQPLRAAVKAQEALLAEIKRAGGIHTIDDRMVPVSRIFDLQGVTRMKENETKYLP
ncbi:MAG: isocitrate lyase/phosphoenolpyruvate mutase family protein [Bryobacterales bacterium]